MSTKFIRRGNDFFLTSDAKLPIGDRLEAGNYVVHLSPPPIQEFYLTKVDDFELPPKLYGETKAHAKRILETFKARPRTTGVLRAGEKGSGKSLLAKTVATVSGLPTLLVNEPYAGTRFNMFLQAITQPSIVFFDEFEKTYAKAADANPQEAILTLLDGGFPMKKLFLLTVNDKWKIDQNMINRPGRLYYFLEYAGLSEQFLREYCEENLEDKSHVESLVRLLKVFEKFNFDQLQSVVEEMNRYKEDPVAALKMLNVKPDTWVRVQFRVKAFNKQNEEFKLYDSVVEGSPLTDQYHIQWYEKTGKKDSAGDDEFESHSIDLRPGDITKFDVAERKYLYQKDGLTFELEEYRKKQDFALEKYIASGY